MKNKLRAFMRAWKTKKSFSNQLYRSNYPNTSLLKCRGVFFVE
jgi:hypothetical protein